jgi:hypothetical protein
MDKAHDKTRAARKALEEAESAEKAERFANREVFPAKRYKVKVTYTIEGYVWSDDPREVRILAERHASTLTDDAFEHPVSVLLEEAPGTSSADFVLGPDDIDAGEIWSHCFEAGVVFEDPDTKVRSDSCPHYGGEYCNTCGAHVRPVK